MRKTIMIIMGLMLLSGCSKESAIIPIDQSIWGYDYNTNQLGGDFAAMRAITEAKDGLYAEMYMIDEMGHASSVILGYVEKDSGTFTIVDSSGSAMCSTENPSACTSYKEGSYKYLNYYNDALYYVETEYNDNGTASDFLYQMDLDGKNRKEVAVLSDTASSNRGLNILFHRGYIYFTYQSNTIYRIDMSTWESEEIAIVDAGAKTVLLKAEGDKVYLDCSIYTHEGKTVTDAILAMSLDGRIIELIQQGYPLYQFKDDIYLYFNEPEYTVNYYNATTHEDFSVTHASSSVIFQHDTFITKPYSEDTENIYLYNQDGHLLSTYTEVNAKALSSFPHVVTEGYFYTYTYDPDQTALIRIPIKNNVFGEAEILQQWSGSVMHFEGE